MHMSGLRYPEEFKIDVVKQVIDVAERLGLTSHSIYDWMKRT